MDIKRKPLSWKPVRNGAVYCAPACGSGCRYVEHLTAKREAAKLCKILGKGWKPRIWENMGWFYSAELPNAAGVRAAVHPFGHGHAGYTAFVHDIFTAQHKNPRRAIRMAVTTARKEAEALSLLVSAVEESMR